MIYCIKHHDRCVVTLLLDNVGHDRTLYFLCLCIDHLAMAVGAIQIIDEIELDVLSNVCWCSRPGVGPGENCLSFSWPWLLAM